jgi:hypothetical protein
MSGLPCGIALVQFKCSWHCNYGRLNQLPIENGLACVRAPAPDRCPTDRDNRRQTVEVLFELAERLNLHLLVVGKLFRLSFRSLNIRVEDAQAKLSYFWLCICANEDRVARTLLTSRLRASCAVLTFFTISPASLDALSRFGAAPGKVNLPLTAIFSALFTSGL